MATAEESEQSDSGDMAAAHLPSVQEVAGDLVCQVPASYVSRRELAAANLWRQGVRKDVVKCLLF